MHGKGRRGTVENEVGVDQHCSQNSKLEIGVDFT